MKTAVFRNECFALFLKGMSLRSISAEKGVSRSALERWSRRYAWVDQRSIYWHELRERTLKDHYKDDVRQRLDLAKKAFDAMMLAYSEIRLVAEGKIPKRAMIFKRSSLRWLSNTYFQSLTAEEMALRSLKQATEYEILILKTQEKEMPGYKE